MNTPTLESVAKVLVINEKNDVLILTVGEYKQRPDKSFKPDLPGGLVDPGETELDAAIRELKEESGIVADRDLFQLVYAKTEFYADENKSVTKSVFIVHVGKTPDVKISWEHASYRWVSLHSLRDTAELIPFYKEAVEYCLVHDILPVSF